MGTRFEAILRGDDEEHLAAVADAVLEEARRLDRTLSRFDPRSEVSRVNREGRERPARVDRDLFDLLERCERGWRETDGFFDAALGGEMELDAGRCAVRLSDASLDLGAIAKGYALDRGAEILARYAAGAGLLQGGTSSVLAVGARAWPIDLRHPLFPERIVGRIELAGRALSCSAARRAPGEPSDLVDPRTGAPLAGEDGCVVLANDATEAEIFSTALLAMGRERAREFLASAGRSDLSVGWIDGSHNADSLVWIWL